jgi:Flp pilus assembly protein TadG
VPLSQSLARIRLRCAGTAASDRRVSPRGQSLVEFALALPLFLALVFGILDFGRMIAMHSAAVTASREASRYGAAVGTYDHDGNSGTPAIERYMDCAGIRAAARNATSALFTLTDDQIEISYVNGAGNPTTDSCPPHHSAAGPVAAEVDSLDRIVVEVTLQYEAITPPVRAVVGPIDVVSVDRRTITKKTGP